jgi:hypothetical protein
MTTFDEYLNSQPVARIREIRKAERAWLATQRPLDNTQGAWGSASSAAEREFKDQMTGYVDPPAGGSGKKSREGFDY